MVPVTSLLEEYGEEITSDEVLKEPDAYGVDFKAIIRCVWFMSVKVLWRRQEVQ